MWGMSGMWIFWILIIGAIAVLFWAMIAASRRASRSRETAEEILRRRYVSGEIDNAEFEHKLKELRR